MNVTEAVDSLSAMFHPSAQLTQPHFPVTYLRVTLKSSFLHLLETELPEALLINIRFGGNLYKYYFFFSNQTHSLS